MEYIFLAHESASDLYYDPKAEAKPNTDSAENRQ